MKVKLKNPKIMANFSLGFMVIGFIILIPFQSELWQKLLLGAFEAGVVGALADWFAVTALFRHPLGIPIPHTALLPKNRERLIDSLVNTLENDWLNKDSIKEKIDQIKFIDKLIVLLKAEIDKNHIREKIHRLIKELLEHLDFIKLNTLIEPMIVKFISDIDISSFIRKIIDEIIKNSYHEKMVDLGLDKIIFETKKGTIGNELAKSILLEIEKRKANSIFNIALKTFKTIGIADEEKLSEVITNIIIKKSEELKHKDDYHRNKIILYIKNEINILKKNEDLLNEVEKLKVELIQSENFRTVLDNGINLLKLKLSNFINEENFMEHYFIPKIKLLINKLENDGDRIISIENWIKDKIIQLIELNHSKIGNIVKNNLNKLSNKELIDMMEDKLGKDISWIRVNGAICGFLIGFVLTSIKILI